MRDVLALIGFQGMALQEPPAGGVAEDVDVRVLDRAEQTVGHLLPVLAERGVDRDDHEVERGEAVVRQIERAVGLDVALDAGEQPDAEALRVDRANARRMLERAPFVQPVRHRQRLACDR